MKEGWRGRREGGRGGDGGRLGEGGREGGKEGGREGGRETGRVIQYTFVRFAIYGSVDDVFTST